MEKFSQIESLLPDKKDISSILSRNVKELPSIPVVVIKLLKLTRDENYSTGDLVKLVETEPAIAAKVLRIANSAALGMRSRIASVKHAIVILGFAAIRNIALEASIYEHLVMPGGTSRFNRLFFWQHCLTVANLSKIMAGELHHPDPEEVYVAGLLHDIGKIILDVYGRITYRDFLGIQHKGHGLKVEEEAKFTGLSHDDVGAYFCHRWGLHESITLAVKLHHQKFSHLDLAERDGLLVAIISLANFIAWAQGVGSVNMLHHPILQPEVTELIDLSSLNMQTLISTMDNEVKCTGQFYNFTFPSNEQFRGNLLRANIDLSRINTEYYYQQDELNKKIEALISLKKSLTSPHQSLQSEEIIYNTLQAIQQDFKFDRLYVLQIDHTTRSLFSTQILDTTSPEQPLTEIDIHITPFLESFIQCLRYKSPACVRGNTTDELMVLQNLQVKEIGLIPITNNNQLTGIIGVDNISNGKNIELHELSAVTIVANELGMALENAKLFQAYKHKASIDVLTGLLNRASIEELLSESIRQAQNDQIDLSLGMVDIDFFKKFNDNFGHLAGDSILKLLASTMQKFSRPSDHIGRFGGEEFLFVLNNTNFPDAFSFGERLRREVEQLGLLLSKRFTNHPLTISIGITAYQLDMKTTSDLIGTADKALYMAKDAGRNKVVGLCGPTTRISR